MRSLLTDALLLWVDGWAARSAGRRPGRRAARLRLAVSLATGGCERLSARTRLGGPRAPPLPPEEVDTALLNFLNEVDNGNHFAAWEEPNLFTEEIRAAFR